MVGASEGLPTQPGVPGMDQKCLPATFRRFPETPQLWTWHPQVLNSTDVEHADKEGPQHNGNETSELQKTHFIFLYHFRKIPPAVDSPMPSPAAHIATPFPASVLQPFSNPSAVYIPSTPVSSRIPSSYMMTSAMLSNATFVTTSDTNSIMSHTAAFSHMASSLSILDSTFKTPSAMSPVPAVVPSPSHKPSKTKTSKSSRVRDLSCRSDESSSNKKKKPPSSPSSSLSLQTSSSSFSGSHKKNCVLNPSSTLNSYQAASSYNSMSVHSANNGTTPLSAKSEPSGRTSLSSSSADSVKHMSIVVSSIDSSSLTVPSLVHHSGDHSLTAHNAVSSIPLCFDKSEGKKRKNSSSSSKACKITKMPGMNSVHKKSTANLISTVPDTPNSSISRQVRASSLGFYESSRFCLFIGCVRAM